MRAVAVMVGVALCAAGAAAGEGAEFVPSWAKDAVWYQIFPERFRNGDASNDPTKDDPAGAFPDAPYLPWKIHPWTSDWYERQEGAGGRGFRFMI